MTRRPSPSRRSAVLLAFAVLVAACSSLSQEELADRYRLDSNAPNELPEPDLASEPDEPTDTTGEAAVDLSNTPSSDGRPPRATPLDAEFGDCPFDASGLDVECGSILIPSDDDVDDITVSFARFGAPGDPAPDPVVYLHGGPGGAVLESADRLYDVLVAPFVDRRDVIVYDQRGAGQSSPLPQCTEAWDLDTDFFGLPRLHTDIADDYVEAIVQCGARLQRRADIDLSDYSSAVHADDLLDLTRALGYEQVNLFGVSYGTRLAQTMLRDHPDVVRSVILSGVYPIEGNLIGSTPAAFQQAMERVFAACTADDVCGDLLPDPLATVEAWIDRLDTDPYIVDVPFDERGSFAFSLAGDDLLNILHGLLYTADGAALIPDLFIDLEAGDFDRLERLAPAGIYDTADVAAYLGVQCREEAPFTTPDELELAQRLDTVWDRINLPPGLLSDDLVTICEAWDEIGAAEPLENEPVTWTQPTLVMAGAFDPITPPEWGEALAARLPSATFAFSADRGHDADEGVCGADLMSRFVREPFEPLDVSCTDTNPLPRLMNTNVEVFDRNAVVLEDSIFDIDPSADVDWIDMRLPDWGADFYDDEEAYWRNVDIYDSTVIVVRSGPFAAEELTWYLPFDVRRPTFTVTDTPAEIGVGWTRQVFRTDSLDIVSYMSNGPIEMNVSVVANDVDIVALERDAIIPMVQSVVLG
ncbi:MAG: alpha/beta fold hydrolase [Actinomycetota bacterium]